MSILALLTVCLCRMSGIQNYLDKVRYCKCNACVVYTKTNFTINFIIPFINLSYIRILYKRYLLNSLKKITIKLTLIEFKFIMYKPSSILCRYHH